MTRKKAGNEGHVFLDERQIVGVDDMVLLTQVNEQGILQNLKARHAADTIYTYIGHVLVVVNPYKWLKIYDKPTIKAYVHKQRIDVPPHVFSIAESAYRTMISEEENQCVIISGESGAGKTEASKQIQNYIASVSGSGDGVDKVKTTFLESNPLLEAFGNAKTLRNNNSSRFGKYFELLFDPAGRPQGGLVTNYLLEKSRVVKPGKGERNFHVFYQILAGLPSHYKQRLHLKSPDQYNYLRCSGCYNVDDVDDAKEFDATMNAMKHVSIKNKQIELIISLIAAILHLGNVEFASVQVQDAEGSVAEDLTPLTRFCELLGIADVKAMEHAICTKLLTTMAPGGKMESYEVPQNPTQARAARDSIAKNLYERLFDFLVSRINSALDVEKKAEKMGQLIDTEALHTIGILDIYGFEIFDKNGFEQFCINYVNEKLQQIFIELTLKSEQDEYEHQGIKWTPIPFFNNRIVCDLIEAKRPVPGIFLILDDTVKTMHSRQGSSVDGAFLDKVTSLHSKHKHFSKRGRVFEIKHYAGNVQYHVDHFGDSNKDSLNKDIVLVLKQSSNKLIQHLYPEEVDFNDRRLPNTAGYKIRTQCTALVDALMQCNPHYVRCIKSNDSKQPHKIDDRRVIHQAQYLGLLESIKVRRAGYAYRGEYGRFLDRFRILSKSTYPDFNGTDKKGAKAILRTASKQLAALESEVQFGKSMVFIQTPETYFELEKMREAKIGSFARRIQKAWKKYAGQRHALKLRNHMSKLYQSNNKSRQRVSMYRPYDSDYLLDNDLRQGVYKVLEYYNEEPNEILFMDIVQKGIPPPTTSKAHGEQPSMVLVDRILCLTNQHMYILEKRTWSPLPDPKSPWVPPLVYLRRRLRVPEIEEIVLSTHADPYFVLRVKPMSRLPEPNKTNWLDNKEATACMGTKKPFTLFNRRHHCRFTGRIYCKDVCKQLHPVPDFGWYTPQRVYDEVIGFFSTEIQEDQLFASEKKTELLSIFVDHFQMSNISFTDDIQLRCTDIPNMSQSPRQSVRFEENRRLRQIELQATPSAINIYVPEGVPESYIKQRRKREKERQKRADVKREQEAQARAARQQERERLREEERQRRIAEKKARKKAEKEAKLVASESSHPARTTRENARAFGESIQPKSSGVNSELAALLARRRGAE